MMGGRLNFLIVYKDRKDAAKIVLRKIKNSGADGFCVWKNVLKPRHVKRADLVISIGGDGTALSASHYLINKPLLAVNDAPKKSEGALTTLNINKIANKLDEIINENHKIDKLERIEVFINDKLQHPLALNDVFIANRKAYLISKYVLKIRQNKKIKEERQRSSGLIFSTGTGSTAWFRSAGGKPFDANSRHIETIVREPYLGKLNRFKMWRARLNEGDYAEIIPLEKMILAIDSIREFLLTPGDKVLIKISDKPLFRIK